MPKITVIISSLISLKPYWSTAELIQHLLLLGFTEKQITGGIGSLRSQSKINIVRKLSYGHIFS